MSRICYSLPVSTRTATDTRYARALAPHLKDLNAVLHTISPGSTWVFAATPDGARALKGDFSLSTEPPKIELTGTTATLILEVTQLVRFVAHRRWLRRLDRLTTVRYRYTIFVRDGDRLSEAVYFEGGRESDAYLLASVALPALGPAIERRLPTGRVPFEAVVSFCVTGLGVQAHGGWEQIIAGTAERFRGRRTW
jgi:hypothetical protein